MIFFIVLGTQLHLDQAMTMIVPVIVFSLLILIGAAILFWKKIIPYSLKMLFKKAGDRAVMATWFTGKIRIPQGNRTYYVHEGYDSRFERETLITIDKAKVIKTVVLDYTRQELVVAG